MEEGKHHLLLVDDNEDILFMLKSMFQFKGYYVTVKDNTEQLEKFIIQQKPDIILMDMLLSGSNGCELCKQIKANPGLAAIPIVMMSAMPNAGTTCLEAGANSFIEKPFEMDNMMETIATTLTSK
jgi:two-component system alkaline phosphatase synthesis response regulator PhoP